MLLTEFNVRASRLCENGHRRFNPNRLSAFRN